MASLLGMLFSHIIYNYHDEISQIRHVGDHYFEFYNYLLISP